MWRDQSWLQDMLDSARLAMDYVRGISREQFLSDIGTQDKVLRRLTILGEAAKNVSEETRTTYPEITWREIAGLRDVVVHRYPSVQMDRIWQIVHENVPPLISALERLIPDQE
jgi:uncharacterized protein with HEPN domain